jgi:thioredoxin reductase
MLRHSMRHRTRWSAATYGFSSSSTAPGATTLPGVFAAGDVTHTGDGYVGEAIVEGVRAGTTPSVFLQRAASR